MKKIIFIANLAVLILLNSCSDFLEEKNKSNANAEDYYSTTSGYESLINACYSSLRDVYGNEDNVEIFEAGTDLMKVGRAGLNSQGLGNYQSLTPADNTVKGFYKNVYSAIKTCNDAIYYGEKFSHSSTLIAEARFLRAYYYFQLVQQFGGVALVSDFLDSPTTEYPRESAETIYTFITTEMKAALTNVSASTANKVNQRVVNHYLALVYLTKGYESFGASSDFESAASYATTAIAGQGLTLPFDGNTGIFFPGNEKNAEILFSVQYSATSLESTSDGNPQASYFGAYLGGSDGATGDGMPYMNTRIKPTMRLYNLLCQDANDTRFAGTFMQELYGTVSTNKCTFYSYFKKYSTRTDLEVLKYYPKPTDTDADIAAWVAVNSSMRTNTEVKKAGTNNWEVNDLDKDFPCIKKFSDPSSSFNTTSSMRDIFLARLAETYLIRAEAYIKLGKTSEAKNDINVVRERAGAADITASDATIDYILDERAREFAGEYKRWLDLKRTGKLIEYVPEYNTDVPSAANMKGNDGEYKILRPIPQDAIGLNDADVDQNPGY